ncbi:carbon-phosphorus lyase complex subunit PhnI [Vaginisenegalia massiliensis]|uniref:carbon-phosphorus lyase complex subunit PhnI n=1 Tax=Vaginisenegalia massiliensis TaxID=2058294 RepID=UPI000F543B8A|nr:carbon-phosphorus lyase complex subunit PhnI [Vaginisenegalia massiliensis]
MGYVAVQGGKLAIQQANYLNQWQRLKGQESLTIATIKANMKPLIDQVMSEASLYDADLAALAIKQAGGSMEEAVFLLRAHRSTLPRLYYSQTVESNQMLVKRRISASFKDIPGGQLLGNATDYQQRFLDFDLIEENTETMAHDLADLETKMADFDLSKLEKVDLLNLPKVVSYLESHRLIERPQACDEEPDDITKRSIRFPSTRSQRLQSLQRGQTGAVTALGYAKIRQFAVHPNIGELRVGDLPLTIRVDQDNQVSSPEDDYYIGSIEETEVEALFVQDQRDNQGQIKQKLVLGYGLCYGQNETKAIAMSILDYALEYKIQHPTSDDEFVLYHVDTVESTGFISHLKLPHYVTFQSELEAMRRMDDPKNEIPEEGN